MVLPLCDEAFSHWVMEYIPYYLIKALFFLQETVPETYLPEPTADSSMPISPLR